MKVRKIGVEWVMLVLYQGKNTGKVHELLSLKLLSSLQHVEIQSSTVFPVLLDIPASECSSQKSTICKALVKLSMNALGLLPLLPSLLEDLWVCSCQGQ